MKIAARKAAIILNHTAMKRRQVLGVLIIAAASVLIVFCTARLYGISKSYGDDNDAYARLSASAKPKVSSALSNITEVKTGTVTATQSAAQISSSFLAERLSQPQTAPSEMPSTVDAPAPAQNNTDFDALTAINPDITGWIEIPGTLLSYPLLQAADNDYYLTHRYDNSESKAGAIFLDSTAARDMTDTNTFIFGHNMKNGSMFAMLHKYADPEFYSEHPEIFISLPDGRVLKYRIFSVHKASVDSGDYKGGVWDGAMYAEYLNRAVAHSMYDAGFVPEEGAPLIALSTCVRGEAENRFVVHAAQVSF